MATKQDIVFYTISAFIFILLLLLIDNIKITTSLKVRVKHLHVVVKPTETKTENRIVSFALYGNHKKYMVGAIQNAKLVKTIYPGWKCRFYHDETVPQQTLNELLDLGSELVDVTVGGINHAIGGMFWRFLIASDPTVDRYIIRDVDSRLNEREAAAVQEWIHSGYAIHSMRDHPNHNYPMNGGMWGGTRGAIPDILLKMDKWKKNSIYMADMWFLETLWEEVKERTLSHDSYFCGKYPNCRPFPTRRVGDEHVGLVPGYE